MFDLGIQELIVILIVALLVFGPKKLPELGRTIGKGIGELRRATHSVKMHIDTELHEIKDPISSAMSVESDTLKTEQKTGDEIASSEKDAAKDAVAKKEQKG